MLKYLRIAVTALCLTACVLLIALWVRSFYFHDMVRAPFSSTKRIWIWSEDGQLKLSAPWPGGGKSHWTIKRTTIRVADTIGRDVRRPFKQSLQFSMGSEHPIVFVFIPYWFPVLLMGVLAAAPRIKYHFSLRTLLIATTLVAVGFGVVIYLAR